MSDAPPPDGAGHAAGNAAAALTPAGVEAVLADFRAWLQQAVEAGAALPPEGPPPAGAEPIDLHTLLGHFVALRHEVHLQTRATRAQQEQNAETLARLTEALSVLRQADAARDRARAEDAGQELRPLLKTLTDLYDALGLAGREVPRTRDALRPLLDGLRGQAGSPAPRLGLLARWLGGGADADCGRRATEAAERVGQLLEAFLTGYTMSLQRLDRALREHGLEPIPCVGRPFDPERMEVVAAVDGTGRPAGEVVEEVRRGYLWHDRVFRYAQVAVAR